MKARNGFVDYLVDQLEPLGDVTAKSMFGGYGTFSPGVMFGIVSDDEFFLKVDDESQPEFEREGLSPFIYRGRGKEMPMSYFTAPADAVDNSEVRLTWAMKGRDAAMRAAALKKKKPKRKRPSKAPDR